MKILGGKVAVVTGGSRGIGAGIAEMLAGAGAKVFITDIDAERGRQTAERLGHEVQFIAHDVSQEDEWRHVVAVCLEQRGSIDILVNNAGVLVRGTIENSTKEMLSRAWGINAVGTFFGIKAVLEPMKAKGCGSIINISSVGAQGGYPAIFSYATSKWAIRGMTKSAARDLGKYGIRVNNILPGTIETEMLSDVSEETRQARLAIIPLGRMGLPSDIAGAALFLASDLSSYITGTDIVVDGGLDL